MSDPVFGISIRKIPEEARPVLAADLSTIGLIGHASEADPYYFPLNEPVLVHSYDTELISKLGTAGYLPDAIRGINDQLGETQFAARIVIVRVAESTNPSPTLKLQETINNIVGNSLLGTGIFAFLKAPAKVAFTPRLIMAPGYTGQMANTVGPIVRDVGGYGYIQDKQYTLTFSGGGATAVQAQAHAFGRSDGSLGPAEIDLPGAWYTSAPAITVQPPDNPEVDPSEYVTATYHTSIVEGANPVCASLTSVLNQLLGHAIVESAGTSQQNDDDWRETMQSQRLIPISGGCRVLDPDLGFIVVRPLAPRVAGIAVRRDHETGAPFHSWANQPVQGIISPNREIGFTITDGANEGQELLSHNIGILVRGEIGSDFAIASGGFVFIGTDNAGEDELWRFYNVTRGRDFIHLGLLRALRFFLGRFNITGHTIQAIINTMGFFLRDLQADEHILGYRVNFKAASNSPEKIRQGKLTVGFAAEEPPVLRHIIVESARYRPAIDAMVAQLEAQLNLAV
jgi:phage tail sheath protein FI